MGGRRRPRAVGIYNDRGAILPSGGMRYFPRGKEEWLAFLDAPETDPYKYAERLERESGFFANSFSGRVPGTVTSPPAVAATASRMPRHAPRVIAGVEIEFCECTFHAVNGATAGIECSKHAPERVHGPSVGVVVSEVQGGAVPGAGAAQGRQSDGVPRRRSDEARGGAASAPRAGARTTERRRRPARGSDAGEIPGPGPAWPSRHLIALAGGVLVPWSHHVATTLTRSVVHETRSKGRVYVPTPEETTAQIVASGGRWHAVLDKVLHAKTGVGVERGELVDEWRVGLSTGAYPGGYPAGFLDRVLALFAIGPVLHVCSGGLDPDDAAGLLVDVFHDDARPRPDGLRGVRPHVLADARGRLPFKDGSFGLVLVDPPYSEEWTRDLYALKASEYPNPAQLMREAMRVTRPGGFAGILHLEPVWTVPGARRVGRIRVIPKRDDTNRARIFTVHQRADLGAGPVHADAATSPERVHGPTDAAREEEVTT